MTAVPRHFVILKPLSIWRTKPFKISFRRSWYCWYLLQHTESTSVSVAERCTPQAGWGFSSSLTGWAADAATFSLSCVLQVLLAAFRHAQLAMCIWSSSRLKIFLCIRLKIPPWNLALRLGFTWYWSIEETQQTSVYILGLEVQSHTFFMREYKNA